MASIKETYDGPPEIGVNLTATELKEAATLCLRCAGYLEESDPGGLCAACASHSPKPATPTKKS